MKKQPDKIKIISIDKIIVAPITKRKWENQEEFKELCASVKNKGVLIPILVRRKNKEFDLIKGGRRIQAAQLAGLKNIPAIIHAATNQELLLIRLDTGLNQKGLSVFDEGLLFAELLQPSDDSRAMGIEELSMVVGKSVKLINERVTLLSLCDYGQEKVFNGSLPSKQAVQIAKRAHEEGAQKEYVDMVIYHRLSPEQLAAKIGKGNRKQLKRNVEKSTGLKLVTRMKGALDLLLAVNENIPRFDPRELQMMAEVNDELHQITGEIKKKINARKEA